MLEGLELSHCTNTERELMRQGWLVAALACLLVLTACSTPAVSEPTPAVSEPTPTVSEPTPTDTPCSPNVVDVSEVGGSEDEEVMTVSSLNIPTVNIMQRVFRIAVSDRTGTAFITEKDGRQYWVTAAHVVAGLCAGDFIHVRKDGEWQGVQAVSIWTTSTHDVAVLQVNLPLLVRHPVRFQVSGLTFSMFVHVIGFPSVVGYDDADGGGEVFGGFAVPLVKHGYVAGVNDRIVYLDGQFNPGFSGSPVGFRADDGSYVVVGVLAGRAWASGDDDAESGIGVAVTIGVVRQLIEEAAEGHR